jgi:sodium/potassium-transporting ATPase subunit alpha
MLWAGSLLCMIAYGLDPTDPSTMYLAVVLAVTVLVTGIVTDFQNTQSESIMDTISKSRPKKSMVKRNGNISEINPDEIVPGDIVLINKGDKIPADLRMIKVSDMQVDNSALTGESDLLNRTVECTNEENALESKNIAFFSTNCGNG